MKKVEYIDWFLIIWGVLILLAAAKGYWQKNRGFDHYELRWLFFGEGGRTHLLTTGIRYFSFFTDAGNYGSNMGFSFVVYIISAFYTKNKFLKLFFLGVSIAGAYGMVVSGTRGALAVPFAGLAMFILISKSWKMFFGLSALLVASFLFLNFTTIGNDNRLIARMRTAFQRDDASLQVRLINQQTLTTLMDDLPLGVGIGALPTNTNVHTNAYRIVSTPHDSWIVKIWTRTGVIGLIIYLSCMGLIFLIGTYILLFKIKHTRLRGILTAMLCGVFGMLVSSYGNDFFTQFPNAILIYGCLALVFMSPYYDKQLTEKEENSKLITQAENDTES